MTALGVEIRDARCVQRWIYSNLYLSSMVKGERKFSHLVFERVSTGVKRENDNLVDKSKSHVESRSLVT